MIKTSRGRLAAAVLAIGLVGSTAACGGDEGEAGAMPTELPEVTTFTTVPTTAPPPEPDETVPVTFEPEEVDEIVEEVVEELVEEKGLADFANLDQEVDPATQISAELKINDEDGNPVETMDEFLTIVTHDIARYWSETFEAEGLPQPEVFYAWPTPGETLDTGCNALTDDDSALYCGYSDTIFVSQDFAVRLWEGFINTAYGPQESENLGDFAVAYVLAHEFAHNIQAELGLLGVGYPVWRTELQADCFAGNWANSAFVTGILEDGDIEEALATADLVGDFEFADPQHHGTPEERVGAFMLGWETGNPVDCFVYLEDES